MQPTADSNDDYNLIRTVLEARPNETLQEASIRAMREGATGLRLSTAARFSAPPRDVVQDAAKAIRSSRHTQAGARGSVVGRAVIAQIPHAVSGLLSQTSSGRYTCAVFLPDQSLPLTALEAREMIAHVESVAEAMRRAAEIALEGCCGNG